MDFWARQAEARRRSRWFIALFHLAVLATIVSVDLVVFAFGGHRKTLVWTTTILVGVISIANLYKTSVLRGGGGVVARALGGVRVPVDAQEPSRRRLLNAVEEMAIASGVPVPAVYVLEQEDGINAFTAGHSPANAAIAITRGALDNLSRSELQGVIAHEFSHILNGDMQLNIRMMGLLFGLLLLALAGRTVWWNAPRRLSGRRSDGITVLIAVGFAVMTLGYVGVFFGRLLQAAVSRQRELLADAAAVQFTRDPIGLRDALIRIGTNRSSHLRHPQAEEVAHMLFAPGMARLFATHPPLVRRIRALDPTFDPGQFAGLRLEVATKPLGVFEVVHGPGMPNSLREPESRSQPSTRLEPRHVAALVGNPGRPEMAAAEDLRLRLPAAMPPDAMSAAAAMLAMVLDPKPGVRCIQLKKIEEYLGPAFANSLEHATQSGLQPREFRLVLVGRLSPALRELPRDTRWKILQCLSALIRVDGSIEVFEYALAVLLRVYLGDSLAPSSRAPRAVKLSQCMSELQTLFATLASHGHTDTAAAQTAYEAGIHYVLPGRSPPYRAVTGWAAALDRALFCLDRLAPLDKARLVSALVATIGRDGVMTANESELLRAICASLHCPLPPLIFSHVKSPI